MAMMDEESAAFGIRFPGQAYSREIHRNGMPAEPATVTHEAWEEHIFTHHPPFLTVTITVRTPTLCIPDTSDRPGYFLISLSNLAMPLITYGAPCTTLLCSTFTATLLHI